MLLLHTELADVLAEDSIRCSSAIHTPKFLKTPELIKGYTN